MPSQIRLIALDLDGTTLDSNREIHPLTHGAVDRARYAGVQVVLASGRIYASMERFARELHLMQPMICANGAHVIGPDGSEILHQSLDGRAAEIVWEYAEAEGIHVNVYSRRSMFYPRETEWSALYHQRLAMKLGTVANREQALGVEITKMMIVDAPERIPGHRAKLEVALAGTRVSLVESEPEYLEFLSPGTTKATGLQALAGNMGFGRDQVAAMGDYLNDLEMVVWAGIGGCVGNAVREVRESADYVGPSNDQGGVSRFIDWILANEGK